MNVLLKLTIGLTLIVIALGAYTRLKDAGLGCPDWPGCYGQLIAPLSDTDINTANNSYPNSPYDSQKAWTEMIHRYIAGGLGLLIFSITVCSFINRSNRVLTLGISSLVIFQALLGMWTVTMRLYPVVVMGHLLGGFSILVLLKLLDLKLNYKFSTTTNLKALAIAAVVGQVFLGGWTSANYAAVVCDKLLTCQGHIFPPLDFKTAFNLFNAGIFDSPGTALENTARVTIQMSHRIGAIIVSCILLLTSYKLYSKGMKRTSIKLTGLLILQLILGASNVILGLPILIAVLHNIIAALLLINLISINYAKS